MRLLLNFIGELCECLLLAFLLMCVRVSKHSPGSLKCECVCGCGAHCIAHIICRVISFNYIAMFSGLLNPYKYFVRNMLISSLSSIAPIRMPRQTIGNQCVSELLHSVNQAMSLKCMSVVCVWCTVVWYLCVC